MTAQGHSTPDQETKETQRKGLGLDSPLQEHALNNLKTSSCSLLLSPDSDVGLWGTLGPKL